MNKSVTPIIRYSNIPKSESNAFTKLTSASDYAMAIVNCKGLTTACINSTDATYVPIVFPLTISGGTYSVGSALKWSNKKTDISSYSYVLVERPNASSATKLWFQ